MKILRVAQTLYPDVTGGGAYHVHALSRDQAEMGHDVTVLTVRQPPDNADGETEQEARADPEHPHPERPRPQRPDVETREGYTVVRFDPTARLLGNAVSIGLARYLHAADGFDVIHAHSHLYASTNLAALKRLFGETPLAITNHGLYSQTAPARIFEAYLRTAGRWTFEQADLVFCYTDVDEQRLRDLGVTTPVSVVPNGVDTERFRPDGPAHEGIGGSNPAILFVGRLVDGKRPQDAVAAMENIRQSIPNATLYLCGDGPLRETLEDDRVEENEDGGIEGENQRPSAVAFLGHVDYDEMPAIYRAADVLVLPSRAEGMPRTVLEARASGVPVVTTDLDHVAAFDDPGVRTVPVEDVDALSAAVIESLEPDSDGAVPAELPAVAGRPASDGGSQRARTTQESAGAGAASTAPSGLAREALDWRSTARETTRALERLAETDASQ